MTLMATFRSILCLLLLSSTVGCSREDPQGAAVPPFDPAAVARGDALYQEHCAQCHGPQAQGHPDWNTPSDGTFVAAPPLDGTGSDSARSKQELLATIKQGVTLDGVPVMPAWQDRLSNEDVDSILQWLQSQWPAEVYARWHKANAATPTPAVDAVQGG